jgi:uncharacterized protein (DUF983 family)
MVDDEEGSAEGEASKRWPRPESGTLIGRAIRLRCPRCGKAPMFHGFFAMHELCANCNLRFERAPGYFLGSTYMSYGLTALILLPTFVLLRFVLRYPTETFRWPLAAFALVFPLLVFRHARALWLALDCRWDPSLMTTDEDE